MLDEPFSGLDPVGVDVLSGVLLDYAAHRRARRLLLPPARARRAPVRGRRDHQGRPAGRLRHRRGAARAGQEGRQGSDRAPDARPTCSGRRSSDRPHVRLVARREFTERLRERSFLISTGITLVIICCVVVLPPLLGVGGTSEYTIATDAESRPIAERAVALARNASTPKVTIGDADPDVRARRRRDPLQERARRHARGPAAGRQPGSSTPTPRPALRGQTVEPVDPDRDAKAGLAFFAILMLYGQLLDLRLLGRRGRGGGEVLAGDRGAAGHDPPQGPARGQGDRARAARARPAAADRRARARRGRA